MKLIYALPIFYLFTAGCLKNDDTTTDGVSSGNRRIFVTAGTSSGDFGGNPDQFCHDAAVAQDLKLNYVAVLSSNGESARDKISTDNNAVYKVDSTGQALEVAGSVTNLFLTSGNSLMSAIDVDETGTSVSGFTVFTGSLSDGNASTTPATNNFCHDVTDGDWASSASLSIATGLSSSTSSGWIASATGNCSTASHLYCISQ